MSDKMLRVAGRDNEGLARPIKTDESGRVDIIPQKGASEIIVFSKDNPLPPRTSSDYEIRDTGVKSFSFPHLWTPYAQPPHALKEYRNIFDQSFVISSTLDAEVEVSLWVLDVSSGSEVATPLMEINLGNIGAVSGSSPKTMVLTPERTTRVIGRTVDVLELPELRQPYPAFMIRIKAVNAPTVGEIKILNTRRY